MVSYYNDGGNDDNEPQIQNPKGEIWAVSGPILDMDGLVLDSQWPTPKSFFIPIILYFVRHQSKDSGCEMSHTHTHTRTSVTNNSENTKV